MRVSVSSFDCEVMGEFVAEKFFDIIFKTSLNVDFLFVLNE